jgi:hypothetical protein
VRVPDQLIFALTERSIDTAFSLRGKKNLIKLNIGKIERKIK